MIKISDFHGASDARILLNIALAAAGATDVADGSIFLSNLKIGSFVEGPGTNFTG